jgi:hypothetical protein
VTIRLATLRVFLFAFAAYFFVAPQDPGNAQVLTRVALAVALTEGTASIDKYADLSIDKAFVDGHYYADKTPGHSFLALPAVALAHGSLPGGHRDAERVGRVTHIATGSVNALLSALALAVLFRLAMLLGASPQAALIASVALGFATPFFGWSTAFFAHTVTGSFMTFAFAIIAVANLRDGRLAKWPLLYGLLLGLILGYALVVDLTAAPIVVVAASLCVGLAARRSIGQGVRTAVGGLAGGIIGLLPLVIYNELVFGSPFKLGYSSVVGFEGMQQGFFGLTVPDPMVAFELLFGLFRGLLPLSPVLVLVPFGLWAMWRLGPATRIAAGVVVLAFIAQLAINSSYFYWNGGWSTGPRHLVPVLPFLALPLAFAWPQGPALRTIVIVLLAASLFISLVCATTDMFVSDQYRTPFLDPLLPMFWQPRSLLKALPVVVIWGVFVWIWLNLPRSGQKQAAAV